MDAEIRRRDEAKEDRVLNVQSNLRQIGVNVRKYGEATLGNFVADADPHALDAAHTFVRGYLNGERTSLYMFSERPGERIAPGCGKTHLATGILHALALNPDVSVADLSFLFVPKLLMEIQATFDKSDRCELDIVEEYAKPELLVWDDFGAEKISDYAIRTIYTLLYEREGRANIFTSNLSLDAIDKRDTSGQVARITSRIAGDSVIVHMAGPDRRLQPRAA